jgi:TonB C terminal
MKPTAGSVRPRHVTPPPRKTQLNLQRRPKPEPEDEVEARQQSAFWKVFLVIALLHVVGIALVGLYYALRPAPKPVEEMISLLPPGDVVKGKPGTQQAHKLGPTTAASIAHHATAAPTPPAPVTPPKPGTPPPVAVKPPPVPAPFIPIVKSDAPSLVPDKTPVKPPPPKPKVKVDLHLVDGPTSETPPKPVKTHPKKPAKNPDNIDDPDKNDSTSKTTTTGLSKEQIAERLGDKTEAAGVKNAVKNGKSGSPNSTSAKPFGDFYDAIRDQVMSQWESPNLSDETAVNPIVHIHVEKDGRVPPESVYLQRSSGNPTYDDSAVAAAKGLGYLHEPLPEGCPPDIPITFKLTR